MIFHNVLVIFKGEFIECKIYRLQTIFFQGKETENILLIRYIRRFHMKKEFHMTGFDRNEIQNNISHRDLKFIF